MRPVFLGRLHPGVLVGRTQERSEAVPAFGECATTVAGAASLRFGFGLRRRCEVDAFSKP